MDPRFFFRDFLLSSDAADPQVDWVETPDAHVFKANLPGLKKDEVQVQIQEENVLQISGEFKRPKDKVPVKCHNLERAQGRFVRRFQLPDNSCVENVKAHEENGVLTVTIPKREPLKPSIRRVPITSKL